MSKINLINVGGDSILASPFLLNGVSVTTTGTQLNYLASATGTTGTTNTNIVFSDAPTITGNTTFSTGTVYNFGTSVAGGTAIGFELGNSSQTGGVIYMDWHFGVGGAQDYNIRIQNNLNLELNILPATYSGSVLDLDFETTEVAGFIHYSVSPTLTASTTQSQGQQALVSSVNEISVCANANDVVTLPAAVAGRRVVVINNGAQTLQIFPASGDNLGAGVNNSTTLASGSNVVYQAYDATNWESI